MLQINLYKSLLNICLISIGIGACEFKIKTVFKCDVCESIKIAGIVWQNKRIDKNKWSHLTQPYNRLYTAKIFTKFHSRIIENRAVFPSTRSAELSTTPGHEIPVKIRGHLPLWRHTAPRLISSVNLAARSSVNKGRQAAGVNSLWTRGTRGRLQFTVEIWLVALKWAFALRLWPFSTLVLVFCERWKTVWAQIQAQYLPAMVFARKK